MKLIPISCEQVIQAISNYIDSAVSEELRLRMEEHLEGCGHCHAILDGTRNLVTLVADGKPFDIPPGFSGRLFSKLKDDSSL